ncbi:MAG: glycosyltransferase family 2 protein [Planctomycetota bacterium]
MSGTAVDPGAASVVIPTLDAAAHLPALFAALDAQTPSPPREVLLVDSGSTDGTREIAAAHPHGRVLEIADFSHGRSRNRGARAARGEIVVLLTQDALPRDETWLANLLAPLTDPSLAATFSRQVPRPTASPMERFFLETRFPAGPPVRRARRENEVLTLEKVFFSNVSAAIRLALLLAHPFDETLVMSEDQQWARDVLAAGHATLYVPDSVVIHSHDYDLRQVFGRYFDSVHSLTQIFPAHGLRTSAAMGLGYLRRECRHMLRHPRWLPYYVLYTLAKAGGTLGGHFAGAMPRSMARRLSLYPRHWR